MATYGVDYYGKADYGAPILVEYAVRNLAAVQLDFGHVRVSWTAPVQNTWTSLALVRSQYGFPSAVGDGQLLATFSSTQAATSYDDIGLTPGYWYYALFAAVPMAAWSAALTYQVGDRVSYSSQNWIALQISPPGITPGTGSYWQVSDETAIWQPAGSVATMAVADHGYAATMNGYIPASYKSSPVLSTDDQVVNDDLTDFIKVLAYGFELVATELDDLYHLYNTATTRYDRLQLISQMVGVSVESASSPRYQRLRTAEAAQLARAKGTQQGLADLIEAATGLECTVTTGPNRMLSRDQSDYPYPLWAAWQTNESYSVGDQVTYQGRRYIAITWSLALSFTGSPNTITNGSSPQAYIAENSATQPASMTASFTVPISGTYQIILVPMVGPANGIVSVLVDGVTQQVYNLPAAMPQGSSLTVTPAGWNAIGLPSTTTVDTYQSTEGVGNTISIPLYLTAGSHTVQVLSTSKNSSSTGYDVQLTSYLIQAAWTQYPPSATPPAVSSANTGAQWNSPNSFAMHQYDNPASGSASTWSVTSPLWTVAQYFGAAGLTLDTTWMTAASSIPGNVYTMSSAETPQIQTYNNGSGFNAGNIVTGPDGLQYTALVRTVGNPPPNPAIWKRTGYQSPYDRELIAQSTTPIHPAPVYDPQATYAEGEMVQYNGALYVTPNGATGVTPPASPGNNTGWEYWGPAAAKALTASFYIPHPQTGYDSVYPGIEFFDTNGQPIVNPSMMNQSGTVASALPIYARLIEPVADLDSRLLDTGLASWTVSPTGYWQISSGVCAGSPTYTGSQNIKLAYTNTGMSDARVGVTAVVGVVTPSVRDVGILFRMVDSTHFLVAFRDQIVEYNGGTKTQLASYTRLPVGTRWFVDLLGSTISVYCYPGNSAAPTLVTTITSTFNQTATIHGLIDWTF
jgi:phage tail-like protein